MNLREPASKLFLIGDDRRAKRLARLHQPLSETAASGGVSSFDEFAEVIGIEVHHALGSN